MTGQRYTVEVNEGVVEASRQGTAWWHLRRQQFVNSGQLRETKPACVVGGSVEVGNWDKGDADFMAEHLVEVGKIPRTAVKVKQLRVLTS